MNLGTLESSQDSKDPRIMPADETSKLWAPKTRYFAYYTAA